MPLDSFIASFALFGTSTSGLLLFYMLYQSDKPWTIDPSNLNLFEIMNTTTSATLHDTSLPMLQSILRMHYRMSSLCILLASLLLFLIVIFGANQLKLQLLTHSVVCLWFTVVSFQFYSSLFTSIHTPLFLSLYILNIIGFVACLWRIKRRQHKNAFLKQ